MTVSRNHRSAATKRKLHELATTINPHNVLEQAATLTGWMSGITDGKLQMVVSTLQEHMPRLNDKLGSTLRTVEAQLWWLSDEVDSLENVLGPSPTDTETMLEQKIEKVQCALEENMKGAVHFVAKSTHKHIKDVTRRSEQTLKDLQHQVLNLTNQRYFDELLASIPNMSASTKIGLSLCYDDNAHDADVKDAIKNSTNGHCTELGGGSDKTGNRDEKASQIDKRPSDSRFKFDEPDDVGMDRCPECGSYRIDKEADEQHRVMWICEECDWTEPYEFEACVCNVHCASPASPVHLCSSFVRLPRLLTLPMSPAAAGDLLRLLLIICMVSGKPEDPIPVCNTIILVFRCVCSNVELQI